MDSFNAVHPVIIGAILGGIIGWLLFFIREHRLEARIAELARAPNPVLPPDERERIVRAHTPEGWVEQMVKGMTAPTDPNGP